MVPVRESSLQSILVHVFMLTTIGSAFALQNDYEQGHQEDHLGTSRRKQTRVPVLVMTSVL